MAASHPAAIQKVIGCRPSVACVRNTNVVRFSTITNILSVSSRVITNETLARLTTCYERGCTDRGHAQWDSLMSAADDRAGHADIT